MKVINKISDFPEELRTENSFVVVALGNFDGVHIGHKTLLQTMVKAAKANQGVSVAFSFLPHPLAVLTGKSPNKLNTEIEKQQLIAELGVDYLLNFPFSKEAAKQSPQDFVEEFLMEGLNARQVVVGFNYTFGDQGKGNPALLQRLCAAHGCQVIVVPPVETRAGIVSSTLIRKEIDQGNILLANELLGYPYCLSGPIVRGRQLGRQLGFPTANVDVPEEMQLPAFGVYAAWAKCEGRVLQSVVNVGLRPTIDDNLTPTVEVNCLDFDEDIYGKEMSVHFVAEIRKEKKFDGLEALIAQISKDAITARNLLEQEEAKKCLLFAKK